MPALCHIIAKGTPPSTQSLTSSLNKFQAYRHNLDPTESGVPWRRILNTNRGEQWRMLEISAGIYTLRYAVQAVHSPFPEFFVRTSIIISAPACIILKTLIILLLALFHTKIL